MSDERELSFRLSVLFGVAAAASAGAIALGEIHPARLHATGVGAIVTLVYVAWASLLKRGRAIRAAEHALAVPLAASLAGWSMVHGDPSVGAAFALPALACGVIAPPLSATAQAALVAAALGAVALHDADPGAWWVPLGTTVAAGVGGVLLSLGRGSREPRRLGAALFRALPLGAFFVEEGRIVVANEAAGRMMKQESEKLAGLPILHLVGPDHRDEVEELLGSARRDALPIKARRVDGSLFDATVSIASIETARIVLLADHTDRARGERAKDEFISMVSHELRTPLTAINGALGLIEGGAAGEVSEKALELVVIGKRNTERLVRLVTDILDLKRVESGRLILERRALDPGVPVRAAMDGIAVLAEDAYVSLETKLDETDEIWADPDRVVQVLTNLLSNAIKFAPRGSVVTVGVGSREGSVRFSVIDRGPGVPEEDREKLFSRFHQLDQSDTRRVGGSGLGLAIAKAIVQQHGGAIGLESSGDEGSTFFFDLPIADPTLATDELDAFVR